MTADHDVQFTINDHTTTPTVVIVRPVSDYVAGVVGCMLLGAVIATGVYFLACDN